MMTKPIVNKNNESREAPVALHRPKPAKNEKLYNRMRDRKDKRLYEEDLNETDEKEEDVFYSRKGDCATERLS